MPSPWHDSITEMVDDKPEFAITLLRDVLGLEDIPRTHAHLGPNVFNTRPSHDLIADQAFLSPQGEMVQGLLAGSGR